MEKQTAVEWLVQELISKFDIDIEQFLVSDQAKAMEKDQIEKYAEFCVRCDREGLKLIHFNDYIKL